MGLFGSKKTYVASTVQNMAGDEENRPSYLKTTVVGSVLADQESIADTLQRAYLKGPQMKFRAFFRWTQRNGNYDQIGVPTATIGTVLDVDGYTVGTQIPRDPGDSVTVQTANVGVADFGFWAEQYIMENAPDDLDTDWEADLNEATGQIVITWEDNSITSFTPTNFDKDANYIYASYLATESGKEKPLVTGTTHDIGEDPFPDVSSYSLILDDTDEVPVTLTTTTVVDVTYSDATPPEHSESSSSSSGSYTEGEMLYQKDIYEGTDTSLLNGDSTHKTVYFMHLFSDASVVPVEGDPVVVVEDLGGGVTKTTTTVVTTDTIVYDRSYREDTQEVIVKKWKGPFMFIYKVGSGNAVLDALVEETEEDAGNEFFPFIPIRLDNKFLSESYLPEAYAQAKKGFKKAVDGDMDDVIAELADSENIADIDYVYAVFGVSVNVIENACRKYMYNFFSLLMDYQQTTQADYVAWKSAVEDFQESLTEWLQWRQDQGDPFASNYGTDEPDVLPYPSLPYSAITLQSDLISAINYKVQISWQSIAETTGSGLAKPDAKKGEVWWETINYDFTEDKLYYQKSFLDVNQKNIDHVRLYMQVDENNWKALDIVGMVHRNYVYKKKFVEITLKEGIDDDEESGFIVPMHLPTLKSMSLVDTTQMSTASAFLVFNSYVIKKTGLLGSLFFKILLIVVIIVVIVYAPQLAPQLVQAASATGTAIGLTGTAALVAGAAINAVAAMVITNIIMKASIAIFGEKLGFIIGTIVSIVALNAGMNFANGQGLTVNFGNLLSAQNLTMLTSAVGKVVVKMMQLDAIATIEKTQELQSTYEDALKEVQDAYAQNLGYGNGVIDPLALLDSSKLLVETASSFLTRTLLTGSDIADLSLNMLSDMADITLSNDLPLQ